MERMAAKCVNSSKCKGHGQQLIQSYNKRRNYGESFFGSQQKLERLFFELIAPELPQISSRAALTGSGPQEKRLKSGLTIGKSCEVYPKVGGRLRSFSLFWDKFFV